MDTIGNLKKREAEVAPGQVGALRDAFIRGAEWGRNYTSGGIGAAMLAAKSFYPKAKVERPRVEPDPHGADEFTQVWRVSDGVIQWATSRGSGTWYDFEPRGFAKEKPWNCCVVTVERITLWADLLNRPTELCDAE